MSFFKKLFKFVLPIALGFAFAGIGGPFWAKYGFAIGTTVGGLLINRPKAPNASLGGITQPKSDYDTGIPFCLGGNTPDGRKGGIRLPAIFIDGDAKGLIEEKKGKKVERWFTGALLWCEGCATPKTIKQLWANDTLIFDADAATAKAKGFVLGLTAATGVYAGAHYSDTSQKLRNYPGNFKQSADPKLVALHGAANTPAYRGCCYSFLEHFPLEQFDYSLPNFRALVVDNVTGSAQMVQVLAARVGIPNDKLQLTALSSGGNERQLRAVVSLQPTAAKELAEDICNWNFVDLVDVNGRVEDSDRKNPKIWDISAGELGAHDSGGEAPARVRLRVESPLSLPNLASVRFIDVDLNHDVNTATAFVQNNLHQGEQEKTFEISVVASYSEALSWIKPALDEAWSARFPCEISLPFRRLAIGPGDVLRVPLHAGASDVDGADEVHEIRVTNQSTSLPGPIACEGLSYDGEVYSNHRLAAPIAPRPEPKVPVFDPPDAVVIDSVAVNDDDIDRPSVYAVLGFSETIGRTMANLQFGFVPWPILGEYGGSVYAADKRFDIDERGSIGTAPFALADCAQGPFDWDSNTLTVDWPSFTPLPSASEEEVLAGANRAWLKSGDDWEIIQWQSATQISGSTLQNPLQGTPRYQLTGLLRGRRGTEHLTAGHAVGDAFVPIGAGVVRLPLQINSVGFATTWTAYNGHESSSGTLTLRGRNMKPFSPVNIDATRDDSGAWLISWTRRDRRSDSWETAAPELPLSDGTPQFVVRIHAANGTEIESYTVPNATQFALSVAAQSSDLGGVQDVLRVSVQQISSMTSGSMGQGQPSPIFEFTA